LEEERAVAAQHDEVKRSKLEQAEARLKYLLSQSDIFSHFGTNKKPEPEKKPDGEKKRSRGRPPSSSNTFDELDDDEKAIAREVGSDEDEAEGAAATSARENTMLLAQPSSVTGGTMRAYQLEGLNWMIRLKENGINGILADEMGLGKTLQSISMLAYLMEYEGIRGPHLVMVPKSTLSNWCNEFARWCPDLRVIRFHGNKDERLEMMQTHLRPSQSQDERVGCLHYYVRNCQLGENYSAEDGMAVFDHRRGAPFEE
jgi:SWI/SNF-related matrix-associated actin-dependent regulator of chromatin subfamily A member 5